MLELYFLRCYQSLCHIHQNDLGIVLALLGLFFSFSCVKSWTFLDKL